MEPEYAEGPSINEWLQCGICLDVYNEPTVLKCSHIFCKSCIEKWAERRKKCPICNADLGPNDTQPAPPVYREMLSSLRVRCNNHQNGCSTTFPGNNWKEALTEHLTVCQYATELCVCGQRIVSVQKNTHVETECELTVVCCPNNCGGKMQRRSMANHTCVEYLSSSIRAVKEEREKRERRMMALPSHVSSLRTQVVDVGADVRQLKLEMKTLMDEARLWMTDTTKDLEALKRDTTSALTQILTWAIPAVHSLQERSPMSRQTRQCRSCQRESLTFSKQSTHLINLVSFPSPSPSRTQMQSPSAILSEEKYAPSQLMLGTQQSTGRQLDTSIGRLCEWQLPTSPVWYCEWCLSSNSRNKVLCSECNRRRQGLSTSHLLPTPNMETIECAGLWICSLCENINSHSDCMCRCGHKKSDQMLSSMLNMHITVRRMLHKQLQLWKKVNTIVSGDSEECSQERLVTLLEALKYNVHQLLLRQIKLWTKLPGSIK